MWFYEHPLSLFGKQGQKGDKLTEKKTGVSLSVTIVGGGEEDNKVSSFSSFQFSRQGERLLVNFFRSLTEKKGVEKKRQIFAQEEQWWRFFNYLFFLKRFLKKHRSPRAFAFSYLEAKNYNFIIKLSGDLCTLA